MTTLTLILLMFAITIGALWLFERAKEASRRRDREIVRRIHRYLDQLPPKQPW